MRRYDVKEGKHDFSPITWPTFHRNVNGFTVTVVTNETNRYIIEGEDQWDWNKLFGLSYTWTSNKHNTVYTAFRYNPLTGNFEVAGYLNDRGGKAWTTAVPVPIGGSAIIHARFLPDRIEYEFRVGTRTFIHSLPVSFSRKGIGRKVGMWFGGTQPSPKRMHLDVGFNVW